MVMMNRLILHEGTKEDSQRYIFFFYIKNPIGKKIPSGVPWPCSVRIHWHDVQNKIDSLLFFSDTCTDPCSNFQRHATTRESKRRCWNAAGERRIRFNTTILTLFILLSFAWHIGNSWQYHRFICTAHHTLSSATSSDNFHHSHSRARSELSEIANRPNVLPFVHQS